MRLKSINIALVVFGLLSVVMILTAPAQHFAAWEQPELFAAELRKAFRSLRIDASTESAR